MKPETCYWDTEEGLKGGVVDKIKQYLRNDLIQTEVIQENPDGTREVIKPNIDGVYYVMPTIGRNQTHTVNTIKETCTCQNNARRGRKCSHLYAVNLYANPVNEETRRTN